MSVTAEQWAQADAERQRQADMVQTLINEVRRLGTEQNNNLQEIQRLRAERGTRTHRHDHRQLGSRLCFQVTGTRGATGVSSCVPTRQGAAELAAHANSWLPSEPWNQDMDAQLRYSSR